MCAFKMFILLRKPSSYSAASTSLAFFCLLVLSLLISPATHLRRRAAIATDPSIPPPNSSFLHLNVGLNLSIETAEPGQYFNFSIAGTSAPSLFRSGLIAQDGDSVFLPILSSPGFNNMSSGGYSFGYLIQLDVSLISLAVCGGLLGNLSDAFFTIVPETHLSYGVNLTRDGGVVPLWIASLTSRSFSLVVVRGAAPGDGNILQLRDHTTGTVVWSVRDAGMMEMQDNTGNLVIYDTVNKTKVVWQSLAQPRDTLFQGQKLTAGMELRSNDSAYTARMEKGGLVLYLDKVRFNEQPAAYWVIPLSFPSLYSHPNMSRGELRKLLLELPCEASYMAMQESDGISYATLDLEPGRCTVGNKWTSYIFDPGSHLYSGLQSLRLEIDGGLYWYTVNTTFYPASTTRTPVGGTLRESVGLFDWPGECAAPMACGPLGVCTPSVPTLCSCPISSAEAGTPLFESINSTDLSKGCRLGTPLPNCILGHEHIATTSYLQVNETATVLLFGGWPFDFIASSRVDKCMMLCSANCSCTGFFYQATISACFFMTDAIGLLRIKNQEGLRSPFVFIPSMNGPVLARSYTTYLKINSSPAPPHSSPAPPLSSPARPRSGRNTIIEASASASAMAFLLILASAVLYLFHAMKRKRKRNKAKQAEDEELRDILPLLPRRFSYDDLHKATKGFNKLLGAGGCGSVYAGVLPDGREVAVKLLEAGLLKGQQSKQFLAEVATVGRTNHHNIVCLLGFCWELCHRLLVYEYMEKGSLDQWLFAKGVDVAESAVPAVLAPLLDWPTRYNVALGIARGLTYLHEECLQPILHFDIKPQNILLDDANVAKLADFGLSKLMQRGISEVVTGVRGTPGYIAPEMQAHGAVSKKSDVYSMGMVMLEIVGGRKNIDITLLSTACDEWHFPSWAAKKCEQGLMLELVDKRIGQAYDKEQACRLIKTAFWCIQDIAGKRPSASTVVQWLEGKCSINQPPFSVIAHFRSSTEEVVTASL